MTLKIETEGGAFSGHFALPAGPAKGLVVVVQEIYGVNREVRRVTDWVAAAGFVAAAPDLLWRVSPGLDFDYADRDSARKAIAELKPELIVADLVAAAGALRASIPQGKDLKLAFLALGWGGQAAYQAAKPAGAVAVASYYPGNLSNVLDIAGSAGIPQLLHFGYHDERTKPEFRRTVRETLAGRDDAEIFVYPDADHGFANHDRKAFHAESARLADGRTLEFLARLLKQEP